MSEQKAHLDYGEKVPLPQRRRVQRLMFWAGVIAALVIVAVLQGPPLYKRFSLIYWQHKCLSYTAPPDQIVFDNDPARMANLLKTPGDYQAIPLYPYLPHVLSYVALRPPKCLDAYILASYGNNLSPGAILFLHGRATRKGTHALVWFTYETRGPDEYLWVRLFDPVSLAGGQNNVRLYPGFLAGISEKSSDGRAPSPIRFYAGQPDPADESHFTIVYEIRGEKGTLDGWLVDQPTVMIKLVVRDGPAK